IITGQPNRFRRHDFICHWVIQHSMLVDACFVGKSILANNRFIGLHFVACNGRQQATGGHQLFSDNIGLMQYALLTRANSHNDLLEGCIAGAFSNSVDRALNLLGTIADGHQRVGYCHAQIIMTMNTYRSLVNIWHVFTDIANQLPKLPRHGIADGIRNVNDTGSGIDDGLENFVQEFRITAGSVLSRKLYFVAELPGMFNSSYCRFQYFLAAFLELVFHMDIRGGNEGMNTWLGRRLYGLGRPVDIFLTGATQRSY